MPPTPTVSASISGHVCIDHWRPCPFDPGWIMQGWWLADRPIKRLVTESREGKARPAWIGWTRPDVAEAFPDRPHAGSSGFLAMAGGDPRSDSTPSDGRWWCEDEGSRWWTMPAHWMAREPMPLLRPAKVDAPPPAIKAAAALCNDVEARFRLAVAASTGLTLRLDIINKCNLRCVMCHYQQDAVFRRPARPLSLEDFETLFAAVSPMVHEIVLSCADEPLMSRFFPDIVGLIRRLRPGIAIKFCTNAMLLTAPIRRLLVEQQVDLIIVSMDGATKAMFEAIRVGARFDRVVTNVLALKELRRRSGSARPEIFADFVMMRRNLHETLPFVTLAHRLGASTIDFRHVVASHDAFDLHAEQLVRTPGRYNHYRQRLIQAGRAHDLALYLPPAYNGAENWMPGMDEPTAGLDDFCAVAASLEAEEPDPPVQIVPLTADPPGWLKLYELYGDTFCPRPFSEIMIRDQEEILPCPWHARPLARRSETPDLIDAFFGEEFRTLRRHMLRPEGDPHCSHCPLKLKELPDERFT